MASLLPGAEPFEHAGGPVGVLLCHGFTGSPQTLRGWADYLAARGLTVSLPRLPGHGTTWQVLANPSLAPDTKLFLLAPALKYVVRSLPGIASDIKKPGGHEIGYDRVPVRAAATLPRLWNETVKHFGEVTQPVLVYRSTTDHVVGPASMRTLLAGVPGDQVTVRECADSYHVATLDNDAGAIFEGSLEFIRDYAGQPRSPS